ncbi:MAG: DUF3616 domain-containing protein, partial [Chloroflexota bacterium]|nr:DUF3616 domain-containing protein [Chloroflexota bacterium]
MNNTGSARLVFNPKLNQLGKKKELRHGLSVVVQVGDTLWVANDETLSLERLARQQDSPASAPTYSQHTQFALNDYLRLPVPPPADPDDKEQIEEADLEGLDYHDGYLWLVGSHSRKRGKLDEEDAKDPVEQNFKRLAKVSSEGNRFLLARIPLVETTYTLEQEVQQGGTKRTAAQLHGDHTGNELTDALAKDDHLRSFLAIPGKDNGFDIEGLAVAGDRVFVGLRGPVLRGWAVILELELEENNASTLKLKQIGPDNRLYRKHFLDLGGLGIRDLCVQGPDLLILAGPTMDLDGPVTIFRWPEGTQPNEERVVFEAALATVMDIPFG